MLVWVEVMVKACVTVVCWHFSTNWGWPKLVIDDSMHETGSSAKRKFFNASLALSVALYSPLVDGSIGSVQPAACTDHGSPRDTADGRSCLTHGQRIHTALSQLDYLRYKSVNLI